MGNICGSVRDAEKNLATKGCGLSFNSTSDKNKVFKCQQLRPDFKNSPEWVLPRYVGYNRRVNCYTDGENSTEIVFAESLCDFSNINLIVINLELEYG